MAVEERDLHRMPSSRSRRVNSGVQSKVTVRHLPPTMTEAQLLEQVSPIPDNNYLFFARADPSLGQFAFSVAYINFVHQEDIFLFKDKFDGYVFLDSRGHEFPAIVEFAPFQKIPRRRVGPNGEPITAKKRDSKCGTIETDPEYEKFLESLEESKNEVNLPSAEIYLEEMEARQKELKANHGVLKTTTPLIEFLKQRKADRMKLREERREERRRQQQEQKRMRDEEHLKRHKDKPGTGGHSQQSKGQKEKKGKERDRERDRDRDRERGEGSSNYNKKGGDKRGKAEKMKSNDAPTFTIKVLQNPDKEKVKAPDKAEEANNDIKSSQESLRLNSVTPEREVPKSEGNSNSSRKDRRRCDEGKSKEYREDRETSSSKDSDLRPEGRGKGRVRNKDRPALEIYRPGMSRGKASGQGAGSDGNEGSHKSEHKGNVRNKTKVFTRSKHAD